MKTCNGSLRKTRVTWQRLDYLNLNLQRPNRRPPDYHVYSGATKIGKRVKHFAEASAWWAITNEVIQGDE